jgi:hypothetical protein
VQTRRGSDGVYLLKGECGLDADNNSVRQRKHVHADDCNDSGNHGCGVGTQNLRIRLLDL